MSADAEQAHSSRRTPPPRPAHPPRTAPTPRSAPPPRTVTPPSAPPGFGPPGFGPPGFGPPGFVPDPETPVLGVPAKVPFPRGAFRGVRHTGRGAFTADGPRVPPHPGAPPRPAAPPSAGTGHHRARGRTVAAAVSLVLGVGLLGGAAAGSWLGDGRGATASAADTYATARAAWHSVPADDLFPRTLRGEGDGPGGADRLWTRIAVAPDSSCGGGFDPLLAKALSPVGCERLLRATYTDATSTSVTTVGLLITSADPAGMKALRQRFTEDKLDERADLMPRPYAAKGTAAARFGDDQRASWRIRILTDAPAVIYAVSGFADGREVTDPQSAYEATRRGATTAPAQSGLGNDARGIADATEDAFRRALSKAPAAPDEPEKRGSAS
ncbi:hypothetical protein [Streptomyces sp. NPDC019937]|uniref:hypothetical protein n=1 Tax=Streptomyces sp. NPDC019937 TaxID=3154787 RepID=UPI0033D0DD45